MSGLIFTSPWLLLGLIALPALWWLLRAVPPAPLTRRFPGVALLLGIPDPEAESARTPWWLLLLRALAVAALILGFAGPVLNSTTRVTGGGPLLILVDGSWAQAADWDATRARIATIAGEADRPTAIEVLTAPTPDGPLFRNPADLQGMIEGLQPRAWQPDALPAWLETIDGTFDTIWLSDGLARSSRAELANALQQRGTLQVIEATAPTFAILPPVFEDGGVDLTVQRSTAGPAFSLPVLAQGTDPNGIARTLATASADFAADATAADVRFELPPELLARMTRFDLGTAPSAGATALADDRLRRREVALIAPAGGSEAVNLLSPTHYLRQALAPSADLIETDLPTAMRAGPDVIVLVDIANLTPDETATLETWVDQGGLLVRFAGPRLAASDMGRGAVDPLLPVRLRAGGRSVGGALSWGEPKTLAAFTEGSPFFGLTVPDDVEVTAQVVAQPDPTLAARVIAQLSDGTPLVTREMLGQGQIVLFHVTATPEWSNLPLSGLFVQMLERLSLASGTALDEASLAGTRWAPDQVLDAFGALHSSDSLAPITGEELAVARAAAATPPGLYAGQGRRIAVNAMSAGDTLAPAIWPAGVQVLGSDGAAAVALRPWLLMAAIVLLLVDTLASAALSGRLRGRGLAALLLIALAPLPRPASAQDFDAGFAISATSQVVLAHVSSGDPEVDSIVSAGLTGLSRALALRSTIVTSRPIQLDLDTDELAFFPMIYWPVTAQSPLPSREAYQRLNRYLRTGGMIVFDTRDAEIGAFGATPASRRLQEIALPLDIPALEPMPADHILTRSFYLLQSAPGRFTSDLWVEAAPPEELAEGMPFRNLNDNVTPVVIGANDWAGAWATRPDGAPLLPVGRGLAGDRQREMALRFGVNLVMHVLTGNYKSDQVHVPELLNRLGN
ncbi:DUF4159 domain-containing protein [Ketogulonicigenium vulgare]|uniref:Double-transmembrane region-like protein n=1 Tax=Ketogulonicigenium vulgare (strain WSH-001) TaxID=759362 RepID=F9Y9K4_KETVW|nr:DUF4159 domain-containing protein [Ketogulonicigenium vulgare]AEM41342.1 Double-transmembrane region-like protein [Ketogulonicigenium vulgare WSH-001]ALJ81481.1 LytTR family transcriptional regulator [Ketogulonicigenium vulgare]ANW34193.1 LytTR family transcriptional regulator [Ketogulonicigenium vulgare]AOZ55083.1 N-terminal double-transmembrane domain protein [Ketogulonicigenium vulgare]